MSEVKAKVKVTLVKSPIGTKKSTAPACAVSASNA
jgi:hypothetical protein